MDVRHTAARALDTALEVPIATSFTRLGYALRRRSQGWQSLDTYDLTGRTMLVTGATSGLGLAAARQLASCGATVLLLGRDAAKTARVRDDVRRDTGNERVAALTADMADLDQVRAVAADVLAGYPRLDVLVHNAGALTADRRTSPQGIEATVASQVVGPFLLTHLLLDPLRAGEPGRVLTMSSGGMYTAKLDVEHLEMGDDYRGSEQYARAKRAQVTLNEMWAQRWGADRSVVFHALHPGWADTPGVAASLPRFRAILGPALRTPDQGADTLVWLAADDGEPATTTGRFWLDRTPRSLHYLPTTRRSDTPDERERLWQWCVDRAGVDDG